MAERSRLDAIEERAASLRETPAERSMLALELSDLTRDLAASASAAWVGTPLPLEGKVGFFADRELERTAEQAITEIQARLGAEPGRLAVVEGSDAGALSAADGGKLGVVDDD